MSNDWITNFQHEISNAKQARVEMNEGKSRVCSRRAAGIVAKKYLFDKNPGIQLKSAYEYLKFLVGDPEISEDVRQVVSHFLIKVTPEYQLPIDADLIQDACWLANALLGYSCFHGSENGR
jgi:hypothetical protein